MSNDDESQQVFKKLKVTCVPLLASSLLTHSSIPRVSNLLSDLITALREIHASGFILKPSLISYTFFPLSSVLRRNVSSAIPDQVLEKLLLALGILCEAWWWDCDIDIWDQIFMLCGAIIGGIEGKGKGKDRDDETKEAAARCLWSLLRERTSAEDPLGAQAAPDRFRTRLSEFQAHAQTTQFIPVLGQTLNSLLTTAASTHMPLQHHSLRLLHVLVALYAPEYFIPSVLPGVISVTTKIALGVSTKKSWTNGDVVANALKVMQKIIVRSVGDAICVREGAVRSVNQLEDLVELVSGPAVQPNSPDGETRPYSTARTSSWLRGTSSQLHIAINTLTPLVSHPTPSALLALSEFSTTILAATSLTLPQTQPLFLSFLLSLSNSDFLSVSRHAHEGLVKLLTTPSNAQNSLLQTLIQNTKDNLAALPRLLPSHSDAKVEHIAGLIEAVCRLTTSDELSISQNIGVTSIAKGIGILLGPTGGVEKWGWNMLSVLEFVDPATTMSTASAAAVLVLEYNPHASEIVAFPEVAFKHVDSRSTYLALVRMLRSLGRVGGEDCLFAVEWFTNVGRNNRGSRAIAALWCACRLLEGVGDVSLDSQDNADSFRVRQGKRLEKLARGVARSIAEIWDEPDEENRSTEHLSEDNGDADVRLPVEHLKGLASIRATLDFAHPIEPKNRKPDLQPALHKALSLHLLSVTAGILQTRFTPLLLHTLYPVLHSIVSPVPHLASTALATLHFITSSTSYASPGNLLLSNFDYALDAVSRRLTRRWLDVDATKALVVLVRLVGGDMVQRAGDVVEECFDRLDEFHGYDVIVGGLVEVLSEVIKVVEVEDEASRATKAESLPQDRSSLDAVFEWFSRRDNPQDEETIDYGPAPREAWGEGKGKAPAVEEENNPTQELHSDVEVPPTPTQALTKQIVSRSLYFLTHGSAAIRARILTLLSSSVPVLPESALLPSIHHAWPFIINRLSDSEPFVVKAAACLIESLATYVGSFMYRRIWDDVWPRFRAMLKQLDIGDSTNALSRRGPSAVGTESAYTHSHRLYRSLLKTMTAAMKGVDIQDAAVWQVIMVFRRFLHSQAHEELQAAARDLYTAIAKNNEDAVWLALFSTSGQIDDSETAFMRESKWDIKANVNTIFSTL